MALVEVFLVRIKLNFVFWKISVFALKVFAKLIKVESGILLKFAEVNY
jgi:hypothetical protein